MNLYYNTLKIPLWFISLISIVGFSCVNDIETIKALTNYKNISSLVVEDSDIIYSDSGRVKVVVNAKEIIKIDSIPNQVFYEFPKGLTIFFYNDKNEKRSYITAERATYYEYKGLWEGKNGVVAKDLIEGDELFTEHVFWNQSEGYIYSNTHTKVVNEDGIFYGEKGFESDDSFTKWKLISSKGVVTIKE